MTYYKLHHLLVQKKRLVSLRVLIKCPEILFKVSVKSDIFPCIFYFSQRDSQTRTHRYTFPSIIFSHHDISGKYSPLQLSCSCIYSFPRNFYWDCNNNNNDNSSYCLSNVLRLPPLIFPSTQGGCCYCPCIAEKCKSKGTAQCLVYSMYETFLLKGA